MDTAHDGFAAEQIDGYAEALAPITQNPIGVVRSDIKEPEYISWKAVDSEIVLKPEYGEALIELRDFSHAIVLFWMHQVCMTKLRHVPQGKARQVPEVGIFACRCPHRPNPIGCTTVRLLEVRDNHIRVRGLDAVDGTPVIDVKPYTPQYDCVCSDDEQVMRAIAASVRVPAWIARLTY